MLLLVSCWYRVNLNRYTPQLCCGWDKAWSMQPQSPEPGDTHCWGELHSALLNFIIIYENIKYIELVMIWRREH